MPLVKFQADDELANKLSAFTGHRVASKAFSDAARQALRLDAELRHARAEIAELKQQAKVYQQTLAAARDAAIQLAEVASQGDMFQPKETTPSRLRHHVESETSPQAGESRDDFLARLNRQGRT